MADKRIIEQVASTELYNDDYLIKDSALHGTTKISQSKLKELFLDGTLTLEDLASASAWTTNTYYDRDSVVYHDGKLYRNLSGKRLHEASFSTDDWTEIASDFVKMINNLQDSMAGGWMNTQTYYQGDYAFYNGHYYRCVSTTTPGTWQSNKWMQTSLHSEIIQYLWKFAQYMDISSQSSLHAYGKGELAIRSIDHVDHLLMAKEDYPQGVTEFDPDQWIDLSSSDEEWLSGLSKELIRRIDEIETTAEATSYDNTDSGLEAENVQDAIDEVVERVEDIESQEENWTMIGSAEGLPADIATFNDGADAVMQSLKVSIEPVQSGSGDPSPTNVRPISGWTEEVIGVSGKNRIDLTYSESGGINTQGEEVWGQNLWRSTRYDKVEPNTYNTFSTLGCIMRIYYYDENKNFIRREQGSSITEFVFLTPPNCHYIKWTIFSGDTTTVYTLQMVEALHLQIEKGDEATTYEPYAGTTTTIPFTDSQGNPVEVYGGSVDVVNGSLLKDMQKAVLDDTANWTLEYNSETGIAQVYTNNMYERWFYSKSSRNLCNIATFIDQESGDLPVNRWTLRSYNRNFRIAVQGFTTLEDWKTYLQSNPITFCAVLVEPPTLQQQPTSIKSLDGVNNVFASTGDVTECEYTRDATIVINDLIARIEALENA